MGTMTLHRPTLHVHPNHRRGHERHGRASIARVTAVTNHGDQGSGPVRLLEQRQVISPAIASQTRLGHRPMIQGRDHLDGTVVALADRLDLVVEEVVQHLARVHPRPRRISPADLAVHVGGNVECRYPGNDTRRIQSLILQLYLVPKSAVYYLLVLQHEICTVWNPLPTPNTKQSHLLQLWHCTSFGTPLTMIESCLDLSCCFAFPTSVARIRAICILYIS